MSFYLANSDSAPSNATFITTMINAPSQSSDSFRYESDYDDWYYDGPEDGSGVLKLGWQNPNAPSWW